MANLTNRRSSQPSSPTRLSPLPENHAHTPASPASPAPASSPTTLTKTKGCAPVTRPSASIVSERSDSGISECSYGVEENNQNQLNNQFGITNGRAVTGCNVLKSGKTPSLDWQSSVDSAVCDDDYISKSSFGSSPRKISREGLIHAKSAVADTHMNSHSRIWKKKLYRKLYFMYAVNPVWRLSMYGYTWHWNDRSNLCTFFLIPTMDLVI